MIFKESNKAPKGEVFIRMTIDGEDVLYRHVPNVITLDHGILVASLHAGTRPNGINMLAVGTGATGALLAPDAAMSTQRSLNAELVRKPLLPIQYRKANGDPVTYDTNIVDFTCMFVENEAVGALNEMGLIATFDNDPNVKNPIVSDPHHYDPTLDVSNKDLLANYLTFGVITKPANAVLTITWRITF